MGYIVLFMKYEHIIVYVMRMYMYIKYLTYISYVLFSRARCIISRDALFHHSTLVLLTSDTLSFDCIVGQCLCNLRGLDAGKNLYLLLWVVARQPSAQSREMGSWWRKMEAQRVVMGWSVKGALYTLTWELVVSVTSPYSLDELQLGS